MDPEDARSRHGNSGSPRHRAHRSRRITPGIIGAIALLIGVGALSVSGTGGAAPVAAAVDHTSLDPGTSRQATTGRTPLNSPDRGHRPKSRRPVHAAAAPRSGFKTYAEPGGNIAHWGMCTDPIPYWVDPTGGPASFTDDITAVLDRVSTLTGYTFTYQGVRPDKTYGGTGIAGITYRWTTAAADPALKGSIVGMTRFATDTDGYLQGAQIEFDKTDLITNASTTSADPSALRTDVYMHETGHAMGLNHVHDRSAIMYPVAMGRTAYGKGDIAGLRAVGVAAGCRADSPTSALR